MFVALDMLFRRVIEKIFYSIHYLSIKSKINVPGLKVTAFVRDPNRLPAELAPHVTFFQGSSIIKEDVSKAMEGQDGVIVALGTRNDLRKSI